MKREAEKEEKEKKSVVAGLEIWGGARMNAGNRREVPRRPEQKRVAAKGSRSGLGALCSLFSRRGEKMLQSGW